MATKQRTRSRGRMAPVTATYTVFTDSSSSTGTDSFLVGEDEYMVDYVGSSFAPGRVIRNNPMTTTLRRISNTPMTGSSSNDVHTGLWGYSGSFFVDRGGALQLLAGTCTNRDAGPLITLASTQALASVKRPDIGSLVALAEIREAVQLLRHPLEGVLTVLQSFRRLKRFNKRNALASAKALSSFHLQVIFGVLPLISDIQGILKALRNYKPEPERFTARGQAHSVSIKTDSGRSYRGGFATTSDYIVYNDTVTRDVSVRAYILYEASLSLQERFGMSLKDIPLSVWQATGFTFLVDWFVNVGQFIAALTPVAGVNYLASGYTLLVEDTRVSEYSLETTHTGPHGWTGSYTGGVHSTFGKTKSRVPGDLTQNIGLAMRTRSASDLLDTFKITASISLIVQRLKFLYRRK